MHALFYRIRMLENIIKDIDINSVEETSDSDNICKISNSITYFKKLLEENNSKKTIMYQFDSLNFSFQCIINELAAYKTDHKTIHFINANSLIENILSDIPEMFN